MLQLLPEPLRHDVEHELDVSRSELDRWEDLTRRRYVPFHGEGIISQFAGYDELEELDWDDYRRRYGDIQRLDRILHAEDDSPDRYKVAKQADTLMLFYLLTADELERILRGLGYDWSSDRIPPTIEYYRARTSHGSTLSAVVHSWLLARSDRRRSWDLFEHALRSDIDDVQGGTTQEGIHLGAMTGTLDLVQRGYTGLAVEENVLRFEPRLPDEVAELTFPLHYRGHQLRVQLDHGCLRVSAASSDLPGVTIGFEDRCETLRGGETLTFELVHGHAPGDQR